MGSLALLAACGRDPSPDRLADLYGVVTSMVADEPPRHLPTGDGAERIDAHSLRLYFTTGSCSTPSKAQKYPRALAGTIEDRGVLVLVLDTRVSCAGDSNDAGYPASGLVTIDPAVEWEEVVVRYGMILSSPVDGATDEGGWWTMSYGDS